MHCTFVLHVCNAGQFLDKNSTVWQCIHGNVQGCGFVPAGRKIRSLKAENESNGSTEGATFLTPDTTFSQNWLFSHQTQLFLLQNWLFSDPVPITGGLEHSLNNFRDCRFIWSNIEMRTEEHLTRSLLPTHFYLATPLEMSTFWSNNVCTELHWNLSKTCNWREESEDFIRSKRGQNRKV